MASIKIYANKKDVKRDGTVNTYLQLIHLRSIKYIPLDITVREQHFDFNAMRCTKDHNKYLYYNAKLNEKLSKAEMALVDVSDSDFSADSLALHIKSRLKNGATTISVQSIADDIVVRNRTEGSVENADIIEQRVKWFLDWYGSDILIQDLSYKIISDYKTHLIASGKTTNTVSNYLRTIRIVANEAIKNQYIQRTPFLKGVIPSQTRGRDGAAQPIDVIQELLKLSGKLHTEPHLKLVVDFTLLQFYCCGTDFIDLAIAGKPVNGYIEFRRYKNRSKDNQPLVRVKVVDEIKHIISQYNHPTLLMPVLDGIDYTKEHLRVKTRRRNLYRSLATISERMKLPKQLSTKSMRYTWATIAANNGVPEHIRMRCQGHKIPGVSEGYVSIDQIILDQANLSVIQTKKDTQ